MKTKGEGKRKRRDRDADDVVAIVPAVALPVFEVQVEQTITVGSHVCHRVVKWSVPAVDEVSAAANYYKDGVVANWKQLD